MDRILEEDSLALLSIRKEITNIQQLELKKLQNALLTMQKEFDVLLTANNFAEKKLKEIEVTQPILIFMRKQIILFRLCDRVKI